MKRLVSCFLLLVLLSILLISCKSNNEKRVNIADSAINKTIIPDNQINNIYKVALDDIKKRYNGGENGNLVNTTEYKNYVLVEYKKNNQNYFEWYNLSTGDRDLLPVWDTHAKLMNIVDKNTLVFLSDGYHISSNYSGFPYIIECQRIEERLDRNDDFFKKYIDKYYRLDDGIDFGNSAKSKITAVKSTLSGVEILFEPTDKQELAFGGINIPYSIISYSQEKNELSIEFPNTRINTEVLKQNQHNNNQNYFINSIRIDEKNNTTKLVIKVKDTAKYYNVKENHIGRENYPIFELTFRTEV